MSNTKAPTSLTEHMSALLDDEAGSFEERRVLDELKTDQDLSKKLANFALIGETMRAGEAQQPTLLVGSTFLDSIHQQIEQEDEFNDVILNQDQAKQSNISSQAKTSMFKPIGGFAVAASFGALAFFGLQNVGVLETPAKQPANIVDKSGPTAIVGTAPIKDSTDSQSVAFVNDEYVEADAQTRSMLKRYVDSHMQYASSSTFVPSVRVIAFTDNQ